jgi:hypothetical protein
LYALALALKQMSCPYITDTLCVVVMVFLCALRVLSGERLLDR